MDQALQVFTQRPSWCLCRDMGKHQLSSRKVRVRAWYTLSPRWSNEYFQKAQLIDIKPAEELKQVSVLSFCVCQNVGTSETKKDGFRIQNYLDNYGQYPGIKCSS